MSVAILRITFLASVSGLKIIKAYGDNSGLYGGFTSCIQLIFTNLLNLSFTVRDFMMSWRRIICHIHDFCNDKQI